MFFGKSDSSVSKYKILLNTEYIVKDIESISKNEDQKTLIYSCLDDKLPQDQKFDKIEEFLKGSTALEEKSEELMLVIDQMKILERKINDQVNKLKQKCLALNLQQNELYEKCLNDQ